MTYTLIGTGPQFKEPLIEKADTAGEALNRRQAMIKLCGNVVVRDADGREVSLCELRRSEAEEHEAARRNLLNRNA